MNDGHKSEWVGGMYEMQHHGKGNDVLLQQHDLSLAVINGAFRDKATPSTSLGVGL